MAVGKRYNLDRLDRKLFNLVFIHFNLEPPVHPKETRATGLDSPLKFHMVD